MPILADAQGADQIRLLEELCAQPQPNVPRDMAMHKPRAGIVRDERDDQVARCRQHSDVPARRVLVLEGLGIVEDAGAGAEDVEVVAVQVDRVRDGRGDGRHGLDDPVGPGVGVGQRDQVHVWRVGVVGVQRELQRGLVPGDFDGGEVQVPLEQRLLGLVLDDGEADVQSRGLRDRVVVRHVELDVGGELVVGVVAVRAGRGVGSGRVGGGGRVGAHVGEDGECVAVQIVAAAALGDGVEPVAVDGLVGVDDHVVALADTHEEPFRAVRVDGDKVGRDDGEVVAVEAHFEVVVRGCIHQAEPIFLALGQHNAAELALGTVH